MCNQTSIRHVNENYDQVLNSRQILNTIHGSAISTNMNDNTIHLASWKDFEEFLAQEELNRKNNYIISEEYSRSNKKIPIFGTMTFDPDKETRNREDCTILL